MFKKRPKEDALGSEFTTLPGENVDEYIGRRLKRTDMDIEDRALIGLLWVCIKNLVRDPGTRDLVYHECQMAILKDLQGKASS